MAATTKRKRKSEMISRTGRIVDWGGYIDVHADGQTDDAARKTLMALEIWGEFTAPVSGVAAFRLRLVPETNPSTGRAEIPSVGVFTLARPRLEGGIYLSEREFDLVRTLASSGKLASLDMNFLQPYQGSSLIAAVAFSSDQPEAE